MNRKARLILINGPAGIGKSTIARRYIDEHPLSLLANTDDLIASLGQWLIYEEKARKHAFSLLKAMTANHLASGHDVIIPHLLTDNSEAIELEHIAQTYGTDFIECALMASKQESVARMFARGTWGEPGSPPLTIQDNHIIEDLYDKMILTLKKRTRAITIPSVRNDIEGTYAHLMRVVDHASPPRKA